MSDIDNIEAAVAAKVASVNDIISTALASVEVFQENLENLGNLLPPYFIPTPQIFDPEPIPIDATKPDAPEGLDSAIDDLQAGTLDQFSANDIVTPAANDIIPDDIFSNLPTLDEFIEEPEYESALLDTLKSQLESDISTGATGLSEAAETAMAERRSERDNQLVADSIDRFKGQWAAGGWELPDGVLEAGILDLETKRIDAGLDASRDITIESFKVATENRKLAIAQGVALESALMQHFNNVWERALKRVFTKYELAVKLFITVVEGYKAREEARLANVRLQVEVEKGRVDVFLGQLQKLKIDAEVAGLKIDSYVKKYSVDIQAYVAELNKAEVSGRITVEQQKMVAQNYLTTFQAALEQARANLQTFVQVAGIKTEAARAGAGVYGNYIAAAVNSLNAVLNLSASAQRTANE